MTKPIHVKPSLYAFYFEQMKEIGLKYGYNIVLHGSMARDLDVIAIPWIADATEPDPMIKEIADAVGGTILPQEHQDRYCFPHGRISYVININRTLKWHGGEEWHDRQYYFDISVMPTIKQ